MEGPLVLKELARYEIGTCAEVIYRNALFYPDRETFIYGGDRITFAQFNTRVNRLVHALHAMGLRKGDVLGVLAWNCLPYLDVYGAAMKGGFIISPFNPRLSAGELKYLINYSEAKALFLGEEFLAMKETLGPALPLVAHYISLEGRPAGMAAHEDIIGTNMDMEPDVEISPDDLLFIIYTSGTTGTPRGAVYNHRRFVEDMKTFVMMTGIGKDNKYVMIMPLFHIGGTKVFWSYFFVGGSHVLLKQFDPAETLKAIEAEKATDIHIVPTHLAAFFAVPNFNTFNLSSLTMMWYAASPMPLELLKKGLAVWGPIFAQGYGGTETGPNVCSMSTSDHMVLGNAPEKEHILLSCGRPNISVHVRIVDERGADVSPGVIGEIIVKGNTMLEFWRKPEDTAEEMKDGWVYTGDMGYYDDRGYVYIADRKKDMIISGGENVFPREVEDVLYQHPAIQEVAVIGVPDDYWVEKVHAVAVLKAGASASADDIMEFCKQRLARYKAPKSVEFSAALPKTPSGKIMKRQLREKYWEGRERKI